VGRAFFPLDEQLSLLPGHLTPFINESVVRLGSRIPFEKAAQIVNEMLGTSISQGSAVRYTRAAGAAYVAIQDEEVQHIEKTAPIVPQGGEKMLLSADGAMVPLIHGEWAEVKTCVVGEVQAPVREGEEWVIHTRKLSYFSRLTDAEQFTRSCLGELHRRGLEQSQSVCAVQDGAEWLQSFVDYHRPDAVRILDFPHAAQRIASIGQALFDESTASTWIGQKLHALKHAGPDALLTELTTLQQQNPSNELLCDNLAYLEKRQGQLQYPTFQSNGWPIASGMTESANKLVVEARLKGAGMHWARDNVNPMLALRNIVCSDRWAQEWPRITRQIRRQDRLRRKQLRENRRPATPTPVLSIQPSPLSLPATWTVAFPPSPGRHPWRSGPAVLSSKNRITLRPQSLNAGNDQTMLYLFFIRVHLIASLFSFNYFWLLTY